ncbi:MAG TPA: NAD-dependent malic enzyme, partial [Armatimonadota bacterium]|nr:NAD-dependent malic enzyme [Armatimonadota bacterium]
MPTAPSASYSLTLRVQMENRPGMLGRVSTAIGEAGGDISNLKIVAEEQKTITCDVTVNTSGVQHERDIADAVRRLADITIVDLTDCTFAMHDGGKIAIAGKAPLKTRDDLSMAYTPGVARVCMAVHDDPLRAYDLTVKRNTVAVVSDGTAVLGLGDIGPEAAMPVMEGKAMLFKEFGGVDAFPLCLSTKNPDEIIAVVKAVAPTFGGINLEDISAPRCFEIEDRLKAELDIPVFHDDQHGTAVVVLAALLNALRIVNKRIEDLKVVVSGVGAAGVACSKMIMAAGVRNIIGCDRKGAIYNGRTENMNSMKDWYAEHTNPEGLRGSLADVITGADLFLGVSGPGTLSEDDVKRMADKAIVFAMANPVPEIMPEVAAPHVAVMATGRSDYPNQINNVLAFPGIFRGALDCRATAITENMKLAAAKAIAGVVSADELNPAYIIPSAFNPLVAPAVSEAVKAAAIADGVARLQGGAAITIENMT